MAKKKIAMNGSPWTKVKMSKAVEGLDVNGYIDFDFTEEQLEVLSELNLEVFAKRSDLFLRFATPASNPDAHPLNIKRMPLALEQEAAILSMKNLYNITLVFDVRQDDEESVASALNLLKKMSHLRGVELAADYGGYGNAFVDSLPSIMEIITNMPNLNSFTVDCCSDSWIDVNKEKFILDALYEAGKINAVSEKMLKVVSKHWPYKELMKKAQKEEKKETMTDEQTKARLEELKFGLLPEETAKAFAKAMKKLRKDFPDTQNINLLVSPEDSAFIFAEEADSEDSIYTHDCKLIEEYEELMVQLGSDGSEINQLACEWITRGLSIAKKKKIFDNLFPKGSGFISITGGYSYDFPDGWDEIFSQEY